MANDQVRYELRRGQFCKIVRDSNRVTRKYRLAISAGRIEWDHLVTCYAWWVGDPCHADVLLELANQ